MQEYIKNKAKEKRSEIEKILRDKTFSLKVDLTTINRSSFTSINCQFLDNYKVNIINLQMNEIHGSSTGENIKREFLCCLELYKISINQVFTITIDNGTNLVKASDLLSDIETMKSIDDNFMDIQIDQDKYLLDETVEVFNRTEGIFTIRCVAHTFQLAINQFFSEIEEQIQLIRNLSKELRCPKLKNY